MPGLISRLYSFADDKTNGIPITANRVDSELNQLVSSMNQCVLISSSAPSTPVNGVLWFDTTNKQLKEYRNSEWVILGAVHTSTSAPSTPVSGDIWINPSSSYALQVWNGSSWVLVFCDLSSAQSLTGLKTFSGGLIIETRTSDPSTPADGRFWLRTDV